jgi:hypothetical protein
VWQLMASNWVQLKHSRCQPCLYAACGAWVYVVFFLRSEAHMHTASEAVYVVVLQLCCGFVCSVQIRRMH